MERRKIIKTPEEAAQEYADWWGEEEESQIAYHAFLAGYKAAKDEMRSSNNSDYSDN